MAYKPLTIRLPETHIANLEIIQAQIIKAVVVGLYIAFNVLFKMHLNHLRSTVTLHLYNAVFDNQFAVFTVV